MATPGQCQCRQGIRATWPYMGMVGKTCLPVECPNGTTGIWQNRRRKEMTLKLKKAEERG